MLVLNTVSAGYGGTDCVRGVSLEAHAGEIVGITGPNGAGKSTLLKACAALVPYRGSITIDGAEVSALKWKTLAKQVAMLPQTPAPHFSYSVWDTVACARYARGDAGGTDDAVTTALRHLRLYDMRDRPLHELSGGELQRVFLARAFAQDTPVVLLDEPTNQLDLRYQLELLDALAVWTRGAATLAHHAVKRTAIVVLHDLNLLRRYADRAVVLHDGVLAASGDIDSALDAAVLNRVYGMDVSAFMRESLAAWR